MMNASFVFFLTFVLLIVYFITSWKSSESSMEKNSPFECGFDPLGKMRSPFSIRFFVLVVLFLIFDIEVALLFPILNMLQNETSMNTMFALLFFMIILLVGLFYEWNQGAIDWMGS